MISLLPPSTMLAQQLLVQSVRVFPPLPRWFKVQWSSLTVPTASLLTRPFRNHGVMHQHLGATEETALIVLGVLHMDHVATNHLVLVLGALPILGVGRTLSSVLLSHPATDLTATGLSHGVVVVDVFFLSHLDLQLVLMVRAYIRIHGVIQTRMMSIIGETSLMTIATNVMRKKKKRSHAPSLAH